MNVHTPEGGRETATTPTDLYPWDELRKLSWAEMFDRIEELAPVTEKFWAEHTETTTEYSDENVEEEQA